MYYKDGKLYFIKLVLIFFLMKIYFFWIWWFNILLNLIKCIYVCVEVKLEVLCVLIYKVILW